jgi:hypothetical protein
VLNPEHRSILFQALGRFRRSSNVAKTLVEGLLPIVAKENTENSQAKAIESLGNYVGLLLTSRQDKAAVWGVTKAISEGLVSAKIGVRKAWAIMLGQIVWDEKGMPSESLCEVLSDTLPRLFSTLENIHANPLNFNGGPLEGYIAIAIAEGRARRWGNQEIGMRDRVFYSLKACCLA